MNMYVANVSRGGKRSLFKRSRKGRGRKMESWKYTLYIDLLVEFDRLRKLGMQFYVKKLKMYANNLIGISTNDA